MAFDEPLAYFITFATYGSHLPGDDRGSVTGDRTEPGQPDTGGRPGLLAATQSRLPHQPILLDSAIRRTVEYAISDRCQFRDWILHASNVRTNHVHVVVTAQDEAIETVMLAFKTRASRLLHERRLVAREAPVWVRHGSTRYVWKDVDLIEYIDYVLYQQGPPLT